MDWLEMRGVRQKVAIGGASVCRSSICYPPQRIATNSELYKFAKPLIQW